VAAARGFRAGAGCGTEGAGRAARGKTLGPPFFEKKTLKIDIQVEQWPI
jgi:hypothetical protein